MEWGEKYMNLYIMRHAIAVESTENCEDSQRILTKSGVEKLIRIGEKIKKKGLGFDYIFSSPYIRAYQTAETVAKILNIDHSKIIASQNLTPLGYSDYLIDEINAIGFCENVLIIGHEPLLSQLIGTLLIGDSTMNIQLKKAGMCHLSIKELIHGRCAKLISLLTPKQLLHED